MNAVAMRNFGFGDQLVRAIERDGVVWFVGKDVCDALEIGNSRQALTRLEDDEKGVITVDTLGGLQQTAIVSESGVYALIFTSRKTVAVKFRKWVTAEVLPSIRETGRYDPNANDDDLDGPRLTGMTMERLHSQADRDAVRVAVLVVREMKDLYGPAAGRRMWQQLGFPVPDLDLPPAPAAPGEAAVQAEGDLHRWGKAVGLRASRKEATHQRDLYASYTAWCSSFGYAPMGPDRFNKMMDALFGHEEHPEMLCCFMARRPA